MKAIDIDPFLRASIHVFEQFQMTCEEGAKAYEPQSDADILTMIGLTGDIRGQVIIKTPLNDGLGIASAMMGGMEVKELDQMAQSALLELTNMICGNALTIFTEKGYSLNITPPTLVVGNSIEIAGADVKTISTVLSVNGTNQMEICVLFEK